MNARRSSMYLRRNSSVDGSVTRPSSVTRFGVNWMYASGAFICGELQNESTLRNCCCAIAVPILPGDVPITAEGLRANEFWPYGRLAQSIAFLSPPGIERLYSGVTNRTASTAASATLNARAG